MLIKIERLIVNGVIPTFILGGLFILVGTIAFFSSFFSLFANQDNLFAQLIFLVGGALMIRLGWQAIAEKIQAVKVRNVKA